MKLSESMHSALADQYGRELTAQHTYLTLASALEDMGYEGMAGYLRTHADEELTHAIRFYDYIIKRRNRAPVPALPAVDAPWDTPIECFQAALDHEEMITSHIYELRAMADKEADFATCEFLNWFLAEQVQEEDEASTLLIRFETAGSDPAALLLIDHQLAED